MAPSLLVAVLTLLFGGEQAFAAHAPNLHAYTVDCQVPSSEATLHSLAEVNALHLQAGDVVSFKRGSVCKGSLHPQGNGFTLTAFGEGALPRIDAGSDDEAAFRLFNQQEINVSSLEFRGGAMYGVYIGADSGTMHNLTLSNLTVSDVRGQLKRKQSGLVVISPSSPNATFENVHLDSIRAFNTTQWSGIFLAGGSNNHPLRFATVTNSVVHDVQGEGIVLFNAADSSIRRSVAWHTGMQHQQTIGTPNGIWTWQCTRCLVEENEAFLTDSPGVDGGAFDIDWGNTQNVVRHNFGHDTQGYCVAIFAANGPTKQSTVDGNLCINNGMSPRLAQRQGAILIMTWNGGTIDDLAITGNRVEWAPAGNTPPVRSGATVAASNIRISSNEFHTAVTMLVDPALIYTSSQNRYLLRDADERDIEQARAQLVHETNASVLPEPYLGVTKPVRGWRLSGTSRMRAKENPALYINLKTAAVEYSHAGLTVALSGESGALRAASDWALAGDGIQLLPENRRPRANSVLELISPVGRIVRTWEHAPSPIDLGLALRENVGLPNYGRLSMEEVRATD